MQLDMSFLLDPFLAFMLGLIFSFFTKQFNFTSRNTFIISATAITLATSYSILLYLKIVRTDFLILDSFSKILPIEQQVGPRIMFHANETGVTKDLFPVPLVVIFYALYFLWFYLGFRSARNVIEPHEPTPTGNPNTFLYIKIGGLLVFVSAGMMLFFFIMVPIDKVVIGETFGVKSTQLDAEAAVQGYMASPSAQFHSFSDSLCNPDKIGMEQDPPNIVNKDSGIQLIHSQLPSVSINDLQKMCQVRQIIGENILFIFVNISTWMFLIATFMITTPLAKKSEYWNYDGNDTS